MAYGGNMPQGGLADLDPGAGGPPPQAGPQPPDQSAQIMQVIQLLQANPQLLQQLVAMATGPAQAGPGGPPQPGPGVPPGAPPMNAGPPPMPPQPLPGGPAGP